MTWEWWWWLWRRWPGSVPKAAISACPPMKDQHPYPRHPGHFHHYLHVFQANFLLYWISWQCNVIQSNGSMVQSLKSKAQVQGDRDSRCKFFHILSQKLLCLHKIANMRPSMVLKVTLDNTHKSATNTIGWIRSKVKAICANWATAQARHLNRGSFSCNTAAILRQSLASSAPIPHQWSTDLKCKNQCKIFSFSTFQKSRFSLLVVFTNCLS